MSNTVITPVTQALSEGLLTREQLRELMQRSDAPALKRLAIWGLLLLISSALITVFYHHILLWPAMFMQGVLLVHLFALQHECVHYTVFRTRYLNDWVGNICGWLILLPNRHFRYEHCDHHTHTHQLGKDPELIPLPKTMAGYLLYLSALPYWYYRINGILRLSMGKLTNEEKRFIPSVEQARTFREARWMAIAYGVILLAMPIFDLWQPLFYWLIPLALGEPMMRYIRLTEHVGRPYTAQQLAHRFHGFGVELSNYEVTATYAGLRPATEFQDFQIQQRREINYVTVGGIRSTGLSAALGIALSRLAICIFK